MAVLPRRTSLAVNDQIIAVAQIEGTIRMLARATFAASAVALLVTRCDAADLAGESPTNPATSASYDIASDTSR
jgi:hypothetical protein